MGRKSKQTTLNLKATAGAYQQGLNANPNRAKLVIQCPTHTQQGAVNTSSIFIFRGAANAPSDLTGGIELAPGKTLYEDVCPSVDPQFIRLGTNLVSGTDSLFVQIEEA